MPTIIFNNVVSIYTALVRVNIKSNHTGKCGCLVGDLGIKNALLAQGIKAVKIKVEGQNQFVYRTGFDKEPLRGINAKVKIEIHAKLEIDLTTRHIKAQSGNPQILGQIDVLIKEVPVNIGRETNFINIGIIRGNDIDILVMICPINSTKLFEHGFESGFNDSQCRHDQAWIIILKILNGFGDGINQAIVQIFEILRCNPQRIADKGQIKLQQSAFDLTFELAQEIIQTIEQQTRIILNAAGIKTVRQIGTGHFNHLAVTKIIADFNADTRIEFSTTNRQRQVDLNGNIGNDIGNIGNVIAVKFAEIQTVIIGRTIIFVIQRQLEMGGARNSKSVLACCGTARKSAQCHRTATYLAGGCTKIGVKIHVFSRN